MRTIFPKENEGSGASDTILTQKTPESDGTEAVKWPKKIKHRNKVLARIYPKCKGRDSYRLAWTAAGKRQMKSFPTYSGAIAYGENLVKQLAAGSMAPALTGKQANDALAALQRLDEFYRTTGRRASLLAAVSDFCESSAKLHGRTLGEAVEGYLRNVASVTRKDIAEAVEEFIAAESPRTKAGDGQRAQLSAKYAYNRAIMLRRFAGTFPSTAVCDLAKEHLDAFIAALGQAKTKSRNHRLATSAKSRNHHRAAVRQFLQWAVRKDYLTATNRLNEADGMRPERANTSEVSLYSPKEFRALLEAADNSMQAIIAIGGLAGLRTAELLRLDWADVWRVPGHVEITAGKAKTRARRLVEICPALAAWLDPFRASTSGKLWTGHEITFQQHFVALCEEADVPRKPNGLRHAFCTYHFAAHGNENQTAMQAGNSPAMIHAHYKGLATKAEAEKWFAVAPVTAANVIPLAATA